MWQFSEMWNLTARGNAYESRKNPRAGVTLIEMLVVVVIIAVFAAVVGPRLLNQGDKARVVAAQAAAGKLSAGARPVSSRYRRLSDDRAGAGGSARAAGRRRAVAWAVSAEGCGATIPGGIPTSTNFRAIMAMSRTWFPTAPTASQAATDLNADIVSWK